MGFAKEFKEFAMRGNVMDMAIGIIIGGAFGKVVSSLVTDVIMPPIGMLIGGVDFKNLSVPLQKAADGTVTAAINYGLFINTIIDFIIIALAIFMVIRAMNRMKKKEEAKPEKKPEKSAEVKLLTEIRDALKK